MRKKVITYSGVILGSIVILLGTAYAMNLYPFSQNVLFSGDLASQYLPFASFYQELFKDPSQAIYSLQNGLGSQTLSLISYYLTSPFNLVFLLFPLKYLTYAMMVVMSLKLIAASVTMSFYLQKRRSLFGSWNIILALSYAFCGFATSYCYNLLWLDVLVFLPLIIAGIEIFLETNKMGLYQISLLLLLAANYYMAYMVCIFLALYVIYLIIKYHRQQWKDYRKPFFCFVARSVILVLIVGIIYVPTIVGMLHTGKSSFNWSDFINPLIQFGLAGFEGFGLGASQYDLRLEHLPTFYTGMIVLVLALSYLLNKRYPKEQRKVDAFFLGILFLCTWLTPLTMVFQMFQPTAGFPFRFTYLISFVLVCLAAEGLQKRDERVAIKAAFWIALGFVLGGILVISHKTHYEVAMTNIFISLIALLVMTLLLIWKQQKGWILVILTLLELGLNFTLMSQHIVTAKQSNYEGFVQQYQDVLPKQNGVERIDNTGVKADDWQLDITGYNDSALIHFNSISSYTSSLDNELLSIDHKLGLYSWNERRISGIGLTPLSEVLLNVTQKVQTNDRQFNLQPASGKGGLIVTDTTLPTLKDGDYLQNQNKVSQALFNVSVFKTPEVKITKQQPTMIDYQVTASTTGDLYLALPYGKLSYGNYYTISVNGQKQTYDTEIRSGSLLLIKQVKAGEKCQVQVRVQTGEIKASECQLAIFDNQLFKQSLSQTNITNITQENQQFVAKTTVDHQSTGLISLPYDSNWQAKVNGKDVKVTENELGMMAIPLQKGENTIQLTYRPLSLYLGIAVTILGLILALIWWLIDCKKRK